MNSYYIDKSGCSRINPNQTVFINGISSSGKSQAMVWGNDKLDGVSQKVEQDHIAVQNALIGLRNRHLRFNNNNNVPVAEQNENDENINPENVPAEDFDDNFNDNDVPMRDMTPFVSVSEAKSTTDTRIDISYNRRTFTDVCFVQFF